VASLSGRPREAAPPPVSVIVPAYNEHTTIADVLQGLQRALHRAGVDGEIIVVDDGSADGTAEAAEAAGAVVFRHASNRGYGAAIKTGILAAQNDVIAITDADGTYPTDRLPELIARMERADMVIGSRTGEVVHIPLARRPAKWFLTRLANYVTKAEIPDLNSGLRVFRRGTALQYFNILPDQFSFTTTITIAMHCDRYAIHYVPIDYHRRRGRSKVVPWDAATFAMLIVRIAVLFKPLRVFMPLAGLLLAYGFVKGTTDYLLNGFVSQTAVVAALGSLQFLMLGLIAEAVATRLHRVGAGPHPGHVERFVASAGDHARAAARPDRAAGLPAAKDP
jgi:glycosyltransferase involved in cell wall biosynthesis